MTVSYNVIINGPSITEGFIVLEGLAVVIGTRQTFTICAGGCWPGEAHLPPELQETLQAAEVQLAPQTRLSFAAQSPREIEFALSSLRAQLLRSGLITDRLDLLQDTCGMPFNRYTMAAAVGATRESVCCVLKRQQRTGRAPDAAD